MVDSRSVRKPLPQVTPEAFSQEELHAAKLLASGCEPDVIARLMQRTAAAVEGYRRSINEKLGTSDEETLIRWAMYYDIGRW